MEPVPLHIGNVLIANSTRVCPPFQLQAKVIGCGVTGVSFCNLQPVSKPVPAARQ
jgi:hypothetical protein